MGEGIVPSQHFQKVLKLAFLGTVGRLRRSDHAHCALDNMIEPVGEGAGERWAPSLRLTTLPEDILRHVLRMLEGQAIAAGKGRFLGEPTGCRCVVHDLLFSQHSLF